MSSLELRTCSLEEMEKILVRYTDNNLIRYDGKDYLQLILEIQRNKSARGEIIVGEKMTIREKSCLWKAIVVSLLPESYPPQKKRSRH